VSGRVRGRHAKDRRSTWSECRRSIVDVDARAVFEVTWVWPAYCGWPATCWRASRAAPAAATATTTSRPTSCVSSRTARSSVSTADRSASRPLPAAMRRCRSQLELRPYPWPPCRRSSDSRHRRQHDFSLNHDKTPYALMTSQSVYFRTAASKCVGDSVADISQVNCSFKSSIYTFKSSHYFCLSSISKFQPISCLRHLTMSAKAMLLGCSVIPFVRSSDQILLTRYLINGLNSFDRTYKEYSLSLTDDLARCWKSKVRGQGRILV